MGSESDDFVPSDYSIPSNLFTESDIESDEIKNHIDEETTPEYLKTKIAKSTSETKDEIDYTHRRKWDKNTKRFYYIDLQTKTSMWELPPGAVLRPGNNDKITFQNIKNKDESTEDPLFVIEDGENNWDNEDLQEDGWKPEEERKGTVCLDETFSNRVCPPRRKKKKRSKKPIENADVPVCGDDKVGDVISEFQTPQIDEDTERDNDDILAFREITPSLDKEEENTPYTEEENEVIVVSEFSSQLQATKEDENACGEEVDNFYNEKEEETEVDAVSEFHSLLQARQKEKENGYEEENNLHKELKDLYAQLLRLFNVIDVAHKDALNKKDVIELLKLAGNHITGKYKLKERKSIDDAFQEMDKTGTGFVSHEEFVLWYCSHHDVEAPEDYVEHIKTLQKEARKGLADETFEVEKKIRYFFNQIDEDHSGTLTKNEVGKLAKQMGENLTTLFSHEKLDEAFAEMCRNKDGEVTIEEFIAWHHRNHPTEPKHLYAQLLHLFNVIDSKRLENDLDDSLKKGCFRKQDVSDLLKLARNHITGKYKLKERKSIDDAFQEMDKTGTGFVSHEEFVLWYCSHHDVEAPEDYVEHIKTLQKEARKGLADETFEVEKKIRYFFNQIDEDHSGTLTKNEVGKLAKQMGENLTTLFSHEKLDEAFAEMDPNKDGEVTIEEFIAWHHRTHPTEPKH
eukprot:g2188.t1